MAENESNDIDDISARRAWIAANEEAAFQELLAGKAVDKDALPEDYSRRPEFIERHENETLTWHFNNDGIFLSFEEKPDAPDNRLPGLSLEALVSRARSEVSDEVMALQGEILDLRVAYVMRGKGFDLDDPMVQFIIETLRAQHPDGAESFDDLYMRPEALGALNQAINDGLSKLGTSLQAFGQMQLVLGRNIYGNPITDVEMSALDTYFTPQERGQFLGEYLEGNKDIITARKNGEYSKDYSATLQDIENEMAAYDSGAFLELQRLKNSRPESMSDQDYELALQEYEDLQMAAVVTNPEYARLWKQWGGVVGDMEHEDRIYQGVVDNLDISTILTPTPGDPAVNTNEFLTPR